MAPAVIGVLGGMSWESSAEYYRLLNEEVRDRLGGLHSARVLLASVDFADIEALQRTGDWEAAGALLGAAARGLHAGGAELIVLATNTMHRVADAVEAATPLPFLHIADPTGSALVAAGVGRVGLVGTRYTMEGDFYSGRLAESFGLEVIVPEEPERTRVHEIIYGELVLGRCEPASREAYRAAMQRLAERGAEGIVFGCTEIGLLVGPADSPVPVFDTTRLHVTAAVDASLETLEGSDLACEHGA